MFNRPATAIKQLHSGDVSVEQLVEQRWVSQPLEAYTRETRAVTALKRAAEQEIVVHPGQNIAYVVVDNSKQSRDRVALAHKPIDTMIRSTTNNN